MDLSVDGIRDLLLFYEALGFEHLPVDLRAIDRPAIVDSTEASCKSAVLAKSDSDRASGLQALRDGIGDCRLCKLSGQRKHIVFGDGNPCAKLMFIGEAPGREEDIQGLPFVGDAGMLLNRLIEKMGFKRSEVYIANIVKCRPPMNRDPEDDEIATCRPFIARQISIIRPKVIMTLGRIALQALMNSPKLKITSARGHFLGYEDIPVMPTFHPAYLLRNPKDKILTWSDAQKVLSLLGHQGPVQDP